MSTYHLYLMYFPGNTNSNTRFQLLPNSQAASEWCNASHFYCTCYKSDMTSAVHLEDKLYKQGLASLKHTSGPLDM